MNNNNIKNPFIGLRTYEEADAVFFRGRKSSTSDLYNMISENDVVVLHAESGEGKSSLLNAGLFPMLRDERFFPIKISFTEEDYALENPDFGEIVYQRIVESVNQINGDSTTTSVFKDVLSLDGKVSILPIDGENSLFSSNEQLRKCAWWLLRNYTLNAYGASLIPVLVFDQFEEVFTRPKSNTWTEDFFLWLSTTLNDTVPQNVIDIVRKVIGKNKDFPKVRTEKKFKALFSLRTEYMGELDYWGIQRHHISVLKNSRYCLKPLTEQEADEVLELQPVFTSEIRNRIKEAIRSSHGSKRAQTDLPTIPAMLLSVVSTTATNNIAQNGQAFDNVTAISDTDLNSDLFTNIIGQFYQKEIVSANIPKRVIKHIEAVLVDDKGKRVRIKADSKELRKFDFEGKYKPILEQMRLIKCTQINGDEYVELTHDALAKVIMIRRDVQQLDKSRWTNYILNSSYWVIVLCAIIYWSSILAKDYVYGGYDAMREYRYVTTNLFKKIIVFAGFIPFIYWGINRLKKSTSSKDRILTPVLTFILGSIYYFSVVYLINYIVYPNHTWMHNGVLTDRLLYQAIYIVIGCIFTWLGSWLIQLKLYVKSVRWPMLIGVALIICPLFLYIYTLRPVISYLLITIALFWFVPYIFKRDGSIRISSISALVLIILSISVYNPYGNLPQYCIIVIIAILIGYFFYGLTIREDRTIRNIFKYIILNCEVRQNKIISLLYGIYTICIIEFLGISFGYKLNDIYSLSALIFVCPLTIYLLSNYCHTIYSTTQRDCLYAVCLLSVIAIWGAQYSYAHFWLTISIWIIGIIAIGVNSYRVFTNGTNKNRNYLFRTIASSILMYIVVAGCTPFLLMGYNITAFNYNSKVYNRSIYIKEADAKLLYVKNIDGKIGLMDRSGKIIIPTNFTEIIPNYYTSYDNLWDDNYRTRTSFSGFILIDDWQIGEWSVDTYVKNGELISLSESQSNQECNKDTVFNSTEEENRVKNQIVHLIKAQNKSIARENNWRFNYKNPSHLKLLNTIDCDSIRPNLSVTSKSFHKCYLDTILPNLKVGDYGIVSEVMSSSYDWNSTIEKKSIEVECSDDYKKIISDNVTGKMLIQKDIASRLIRLAEIFENGDRFQETEYLSLLSFTKGRYQDMGKVLYLTSLLRQNKNDKAVMFINQKQNELYQESGYFPEEEYAWMHITYSPLVWHLSSNDRNKLKELGYVYSIEEELPFDRIQLLPDSINGNIYRYSKSFSLPNGYSRSYFYYVKDGKRITPPFSFWSDIMEYGDPHLVINCITKKRQFIKSQDIIGEEYTLEEISGNKDGAYPGPIYSKKYLKQILNENPGKYKVTKSYRRAGSFPNTFLSPQIIKGEYDHAWPFSEGLAAVEIGGKIGFINREGDIVIEPQFKSPFSPVKGFLGDFYYIYSSKNLYNPYFINGVCPVYNESGNLIWIDQIGKRTNKPVELPLKGIE